MIPFNASRCAWRAMSRSAATSLALGFALAVVAGGLALADIAVSPQGTPSGTVLVCAGKKGAMRFVGRRKCQSRPGCPGFLSARVSAATVLA
jgi:hypothetical protein